MDPAILQIVSTAGGWAIAITVAIIALVPRKGSLENARIDQLQEDLAAERQARISQDTRLERIDRVNNRYRKRDIAWQRHYHMIQQGVEAGTIPPWPDLPEIIVEADDD
ncbi:membrane protein [Microbacterium phage Alakazam]|nr:membrane protein [Microbacterium phage Alakazam]